MKSSEPLYNICDIYRVTNDEYISLCKEFDSYAKWLAWQLIKKNSKNSHTNDWEDVYQEIIWSIIRAATYYKRQTYIENCFKILSKWIKDDFLKKLLEELKVLWNNRKRHGANKQVFGEHQEKILDSLINSCIPIQEKPNKDSSLIINKEFSGYCKAVAWNTLKSIGRIIKKEKPIRNSSISISEFDYLIC